MTSDGNVRTNVGRSFHARDAAKGNLEEGVWHWWSLQTQVHSVVFIAPTKVLMLSYSTCLYYTASYVSTHKALVD